MRLLPVFKKNYPKLDWIQVEISSYCDSKCIYCPHTEYLKNWQNRLFPIELFKKLIPAFKKTKLVYLQGWGEPFTHPEFIDFLRLAKQSGCMVGTTTNGTLLNREKIEQLIDEGLDVIGFSLAGIDEKNDVIRKGNSLKKVLKCIEDIQKIKSIKSADNPKIHIAYMLLKSGIDEIYKLPSFCKNTGIDQTVVSSLSLVVNESLVNETLAEFEFDLSDTDLMSDFSRAGIAFNIVSPYMKESFCSENLERGIVVGSSGVVSPCVMGTVPAVGENYFFKGKKRKLENIDFGNVSNESLNTIWNKKEYKDFIKSHRKRNYPEPCLHCNKRFIV